MKKEETNELLNPTEKKSPKKSEAGLGQRAIGASKMPTEEAKQPGDEFEDCLKQIDGNIILQIFDILNF